MVSFNDCKMTLQNIFEKYLKSAGKGKKKIYSESEKLN